MSSGSLPARNEDHLAERSLRGEGSGWWARVISRIDRPVFVPSLVPSLSPLPTPSPSLLSLLILSEENIAAARQSIPGEGVEGDEGGERMGGGGRRGWRLIFCSLASASSSASGRGVANPANGLERSTIHHLRSFVRVANPPSSPSFLRSFTLRPLFSPPLFISPFSLLLFEGRRNRLLFRVKAFCVSQRVGATS